MIVGNSNDEEEKLGLFPDFETNEYLIVEVAILNVLLNARYKKNTNEIT